MRKLLTTTLLCIAALTARGAQSVDTIMVDTIGRVSLSVYANNSKDADFARSYHIARLLNERLQADTHVGRITLSTEELDRGLEVGIKFDSTLVRIDNMYITMPASLTDSDLALKIYEYGREVPAQYGFFRQIPSKELLLERIAFQNDEPQAKERYIPRTPKSQRDSIILVVNMMDSLSSLLVDLMPDSYDEYNDLLVAESDNYEDLNSINMLARTKYGLWTLEHSPNNRDEFIRKIIAIAVDASQREMNTIDLVNRHQLYEWIHIYLPEIVAVLDHYSEDQIFGFWRTYFATMHPKENQQLLDRALELCDGQYSRSASQIRGAHQYAIDNDMVVFSTTRKLKYDVQHRIRQSKSKR